MYSDNGPILMKLLIAEREIPPDVTVIELKGRLAVGRESQRIEAIVNDLAKTARKVIFDLTGVEYIDSTGIGIVALASGKLRESGGSLVLVAPPKGQALQLLNLTQMNLIVRVFSTLDEAAATV